MESDSSARFEWLGELGSGATGAVRLAFDQRRGVRVAVKRMHNVGPEAQFRLKQEFRAVRDLIHPNLVRLYDLVADDHETFFTMEPIEGQELNRALVPGGAPAGAPADLATHQRAVCAAVAQLAAGVTALHEAGIIHRDIKPSNVLIEAKGRVVLLDFGFASPVLEAGQPSESAQLVGTLSYMAPECLWGSPPSFASDWYSVGALAAELLLGRPVFAGSIAELVLQKDRPPASFLDRLPGLAPALDGLLCRLLSRTPHERPTGDEVWAVLQELGGRPSVGAPVPAAPFVGRRDELAQLRTFVAGQAGAAVVRVRGPSGIGKSTLVSAWLADLPRDTLVFSGRCHPREQVRFSLLDQVMDELSRHLRHLPSETLAALLPPDAALLATLFPVLSRVPGLGGEGAAFPVDPLERRRLAVTALRKLWAALAARQRVVIWIDDAQWSDRDGLLLLRELTGSTPTPAITWILSHRSAARGEAEPLAELEPFVLPHLVLNLQGLQEGDAELLSLALGTPQALVPAVVKEAGGYPFLVTEIARYLGSRGAPQGRPETPVFSLAEIVQARVATLSAKAQTLLEYLSLAVEPLVPEVLRALVPDMAGAALPALEAAGFVRSTSARKATAFEPYHHRISETVAAGLSPERSRQCHRGLAEALNQMPGVPLAGVAFHYRMGGEVERGLTLTLAAAEEASKALAFDEAVGLLREAIALHPAPVPWGLHRDLGQALFYAGHCGQAALAYLEAARAAGEQEQAPAQVQSLRRQAGEQHLYAGEIEQGRALLREVMRNQGVRMPRSPILAAAGRRFRFLLHRPRPASFADEPSRLAHAERVDTLWNVAKGTVMVEHVLGDSLALQSLLEALRTGDPARILVPLGHEAVSEANVGGPLFGKRAYKLLEETARLVAQASTPFNRGWLHLCQGAVAYFNGRWRQAALDLSTAAEIFRGNCAGAIYEYAVANTFLVAAMAFQGRFTELGGLVTKLREWAMERGNLFAEASFASGNRALYYLARNEPERALDEAERALAKWIGPNFTSQHYDHFIAATNAWLYAGEPWRAWGHVVKTWPKLGKAYFLSLDCIGVQLREVRARVALAAAGAAADAPAALAAWTRARLLKVAAAEMRRIRSSRQVHARPTADSIGAGLAFFQGKSERARGMLSEAVHGFDAAGMEHLRESARLQLALLLPLDATTAQSQAQAARAGLRALGVLEPDRFCNAMVALPFHSGSSAASLPGVPALQSPSG